MLKTRTLSQLSVQHEMKTRRSQDEAGQADRQSAGGSERTLIWRQRWRCVFCCSAVVRLGGSLPTCNMVSNTSCHD